MYESVTYEALLRRMLGRVLEQDRNLDTREGSILYNALAPAAAELANLYIQLDAVLDQSFADTAMGEYLERRAAERGLAPYPATRAVLKGEFNLDIPLGSRFSLEELNYTATERRSDGSYRMECETAGAVGNTKLGDLIPIQYLNGLTHARLTELLIPGEDREGAEDLRRRYFSSLNTQAFGGNIADYREKVTALDGVGACKVYPVWNGGGTVKVLLLDSTYSTPSNTLVDWVQQAVDPGPEQGAGHGLAPIGHTVTVEGAASVPVEVGARITYQEGWDWGRLQPEAERALEEYFLSLAKEWADSERLIVRVSQIETRLLGLAGVVDIADTTLGGQPQNLVLESGQIPVRGALHG